MTKNSTILVICFGSVLACLTLSAQDDSPRDSYIEQRFKKLDSNGDGKLTAEETGNAKLHERMDLNADGMVTLEEARKALQSMRAMRDVPTAPPATVAEDLDVNAKPAPAPAKPPISSSRVFTGMTFSKDYEAGAKDSRGQLMGGTEILRLLQNGGKLFASTGVWMDIPYGPRSEGEPVWTGPQILIKESTTASWRVDVSFPNARRVDAMISATFTTDGKGRKMDQPVSLLVASPSSENLATWTRDGTTGKWTENPVVEGLRGGLRSFCMHTDKETGVQYLFGGSTAKGSVFRAVYDPAAPGKLRWHKEPELSGTGRIMCMVEADGVLYAAGGIKDETPLSGGLFRRIDGKKPRWELVWRWPHKATKKGDEMEIMRGLTAIPDPAGGKHQILLGTCNYPGVVYRIDPGRKFAVTIELDIKAYFAKAFDVTELSGPCLSAYNNFLPATDPDTGEAVHLLGVWVIHPDRQSLEFRSSAWYLVRHADGTYAHGRIFDAKNPKPNPPRGLLATRTIEISPFPEDKGRVLYFGGFDCAHIKSHNTAWIYKAILPSASKEKP